jgi:hypothetical protein
MIWSQLAPILCDLKMFTMNMTTDLMGSGDHASLHAYRNDKGIGKPRKTSLYHSYEHGALRTWDCGYDKCNVQHFRRKCLSAGEYPTQPVIACDNYRRRNKKSEKSFTQT